MDRSCCNDNLIYSIDSCAAICYINQWKYFALEAGDATTGACRCGNDLQQATSLGISTSCTYGTGGPNVFSLYSIYTLSPTIDPTNYPTINPTIYPTVSTNKPTIDPTLDPSTEPTTMYPTTDIPTVATTIYSITTK
eukprot:474457_1